MRKKHSTRVAFKPNKRVKKHGVTYPEGSFYTKTRSTGGTCFTISFQRLARHLKRGGTLEAGEEIERFEVDETGITIFITGAPQCIGNYRYLPLEEELG